MGDRRTARLCCLPKDCENEEYKKLIKGLCSEGEVHVHGRIRKGFGCLVWTCQARRRWQHQEGCSYFLRRHYRLWRGNSCPFGTLGLPPKAGRWCRDLKRFS